MGPPQIPTRQLFINGKWVQPAKKGRMDVVSPIDESIIGSIPLATPEDVDTAVKAANAAKGFWGKTTGGHAWFGRRTVHDISCRCLDVIRILTTLLRGIAGAHRAGFLRKIAAAVGRQHPTARTAVQPMAHVSAVQRCAVSILEATSNWTSPARCGSKSMCWRVMRRWIMGSPSQKRLGTLTMWRPASTITQAWPRSSMGGRWLPDISVFSDQKCSRPATALPARFARKSFVPRVSEEAFAHTDLALPALHSGRRWIWGKRASKARFGASRSAASGSSRPGITQCSWCCLQFTKTKKD